MKPNELLNIAYNTEVEIEPLTAIPQLNLMVHTYPCTGPLRISRFPFYIALSLKRANMCRIRLPSFLCLDNLKGILNSEIENKNEYSYIHPHLFTLGKELIAHCYDVEDPENIIVHLEKIKDLRFKKTLWGLRSLDGNAINLNNLTQFEFYEVRDLIFKSMKMARTIDRCEL